jgi:hypothetical protein
MNLKRQCCVCGLVLEAGDTGAPTSHGYCRLCVAAILRQLTIWEIWKED